MAEQGLSTQKKVIAGAALGVAVPAAIGVAKKLVGGDDSGEESTPGSEQRRSDRPKAQPSSQSTRSGGSSKASRSTRARSGTRSRSSSTRSTTTAKRASTGASRTKEQLYREAKRLNVEG